MSKVMRQMPRQVGREAVECGEAALEAASDETCGPRRVTQDTGSALLEAALTKENLQKAFKRVRANKGAAGVDGLDINQTIEHLKSAWPAIKKQLLTGVVPACSGAQGDDPQTRWRRARARHRDGDGSVDPASTATSAATHTGCQLQ